MNYTDRSGIKDIFNLINSFLPELTNSERKVAQLILNERENLTNMTILDIAQNAKVSEASVIRFCNRVGFKKLIDLKIQIAKDSSVSLDLSSNTSQLDDFINVVKNTESLLDHEKIVQAVDIIEQANYIFFYGVAASGISARVGEDSFQRLGLNASAVTEDHFQVMKAASMKDGDLVIAFSLSGNTKDICVACQIAKDRGAKVIAITSYPNSIVAKLSNIVILTSAKEDLVDGGKITGYVSQLYALDAIKHEYASRHTSEVAKLKELIGASIITKKY